MIHLILILAFICNCHGLTEEFDTTLQPDWSGYGWYDYYFGYGWDEDDNVDLCWPTNVCLQSYTSGASDWYWYSFPEYTSNQYECQSAIPYLSYYSDSQQCSTSDSDSKWSQPVNDFKKNYISCNNDCTSYVVIRQYTIDYDFDYPSNTKQPNDDGYYGYYNWDPYFVNTEESTNSNTEDWYDWYYNYYQNPPDNTDSDQSPTNTEDGDYQYYGGWNYETTNYYHDNDYGNGYHWYWNFNYDYEIDCDESVNYEERIKATGCYPNLNDKYFSASDSYNSKSISCTSTSYTIKYYDGSNCDGEVVETTTYENGCHEGTEESAPYKIKILSCVEPEEPQDTPTTTDASTTPDIATTTDTDNPTTTDALTTPGIATTTDTDTPATTDASTTTDALTTQDSDIGEDVIENSGYLYSLIVLKFVLILVIISA